MLQCNKYFVICNCCPLLILFVLSSKILSDGLFILCIYFFNVFGILVFSFLKLENNLMGFTKIFCKKAGFNSRKRKSFRVKKKWLS